MTEKSTSPSENCVSAWTRLVCVSQAVLEQVEADLKAADMPPLVWYDVLLELKHAASGGLRPFQLEAQMLLAQYNMSRLLDRITKAGYAERLPCCDDGRGTMLRITSKGRGLLKRMWPVYCAGIMRNFSEKLEEGEAVELARILNKLYPSGKDKETGG